MIHHRVIMIMKQCRAHTIGWHKKQSTTSDDVDENSRKKKSKR